MFSFTIKMKQQNDPGFDQYHDMIKNCDFSIINQMLVDEK